MMADDLSSSRPDSSGDKTNPVPAALDGELMLPARRMRAAETEPPRPSPTPSFRLRLSTALVGAMAGLLVCAGVGGGLYAYAGRARAIEPDHTVLALNRLQDDMGKLKAGVETLRASTDLTHQDESVRALKKSVDTLKAEFDTLRTNNSATLAQLGAKLDKPDPTSPKLTDIAARLDRIEKQVSSPAPVGSIAAPVRPAPPLSGQTVAVQAVQAIDKPLPKPVTLGNWTVRDVYDGIALVEARQGGVREVSPGEFLPGAGEVRSIERRGRAWIVVTSRGIIDTATW